MDGKPDPNDSGPFAAAYRDGWNAESIEPNPYNDNTDFIGQQLKHTWTRGYIARLDSKRRIATLATIKQRYCMNDAEDPRDGTQFDLDVIAAIDALIKKYSNL